MSFLNNPTLAIFSLLGLVWLGYGSIHPKQHHYALVERPMSFKQRQVAALREVWGLTDEDIAKPIDIFH